MPAELAVQFFREMCTTKPSRKIQPVCSVIQLLNSLGMKSEAITVVVFSRIQREQQLDSREYGSYTSENSRIFRECLVGQISRKGGVRVTQNIVKKGPTLITFDIKHLNGADSN